MCTRPSAASAIDGCEAPVRNEGQPAPVPATIRQVHEVAFAVCDVDLALPVDRDRRESVRTFVGQPCHDPGPSAVRRVPDPGTFGAMTQEGDVGVALIVDGDPRTFIHAERGHPDADPRASRVCGIPEAGAVVASVGDVDGAGLVDRFGVPTRHRDDLRGRRGGAVGRGVGSRWLDGQWSDGQREDDREGEGTCTHRISSPLGRTRWSQGARAPSPRRRDPGDCRRRARQGLS